MGTDLNASADVRLTQLPSLDGTAPGRRLEDGEEGADIACAIASGSPHLIQARMTGPQSHPSATVAETVGVVIREGWIQRTDFGGTGEADIELLVGGLIFRPELDTVCTLSIENSLSDSQFTVDTGRAYARFDCLTLANPPTTGCRASGAFTLERCAESLPE